MACQRRSLVNEYCRDDLDFVAIQCGEGGRGGREGGKEEERERGKERGRERGEVAEGGGRER